MKEFIRAAGIHLLVKIGAKHALEMYKAYKRYANA